MTDFLHTLNDRQLEAVKQVEGPVLIMAAPVPVNEGSDLPDCLHAFSGHPPQ